PPRVVVGRARGTRHRVADGRSRARPPGRRPTALTRWIACGRLRDDELMQRAVEVARGARRHAAPRPAVGCVIAMDGVILAGGATGRFPSGAHAEAAALQAAGARARGATLYTTLEPCDHHGNTPPCTDSIIDAGVARVVVALGDPDEKVAGRGFGRLTGSGIDVAGGGGAPDAARDLAPSLPHRRTRPAVL